MLSVWATLLLNRQGLAMALNDTCRKPLTQDSEQLGYRAGEFSEPPHEQVVSAGIPVSSWRAVVLTPLGAKLTALAENADRVATVVDSMGTGRDWCGKTWNSLWSCLLTITRWETPLAKLLSLLPAGSLLHSIRNVALRNADPLVSRLTGQLWHRRMLVLLLTQATVDP